MTLRARTGEDHFALLFQRIQWRIGVRQRCHPGVDRVRQGTHPFVREEYLLKGIQVVEQSLRRRILNLCMGEQGPQCLFLQGEESAVELIAAGGFGPRGHGFSPSGPVSRTSVTPGTIRHTSTVVSSEGALVAGSIKRIFGGKANVMRIRPFSRKLL